MFSSYETINDNLPAKDRQEYWEAAFGLQAVDDLKPSKYLEELSKEHIDGQKTYVEVARELDNYYIEKQPLSGYTLEQEADFVSRAIYEILADGAFSFNPLTLKIYHRRLFERLPEKIFHPGEFRTKNLTKKEPILDGDTVQYQDFGMIQESLDYDFTEEKSQDYSSMSDEGRIKRLAEFISRIWQVHPFMEGNTRTTAVFLQKYLRSLGYNVDNELFDKNSKYFRDALVRANYANLPKNIMRTDRFLVKFFENLILGETNELDKEELHI